MLHLVNTKIAKIVLEFMGIDRRAVWISIVKNVIINVDLDQTFFFTDLELF